MCFLNDVFSFLLVLYIISRHVQSNLFVFSLSPCQRRCKFRATNNSQFTQQQKTNATKNCCRISKKMLQLPHFCFLAGPMNLRIFFITLPAISRLLSSLPCPTLLEVEKLLLAGACLQGPQGTISQHETLRLANVDDCRVLMTVRC